MSDGYTADCTSVQKFAYSVDFVETLFCKYDAHAKCPQLLDFSVFSGPCRSVKLHPQEVLAANLY